MTYPNGFEEKIGFDEVRSHLKEHCLSTLGKERVDGLCFLTDATIINDHLMRVREFRKMMEQEERLPLQYFYDVRPAVTRLRLAGTHIDERELFDLRRSQQTVADFVTLLNKQDDEEFRYPTLQRLTEDVQALPQLMRRIDQVLDKYGHIRDDASPELQRIRKELSRTANSISNILNTILRGAQSEGLVDKDVTPTLRDGRLVIPVAPAMKRRLRGIVHDESATGKTVFIEPAEVVEANNHIRELESDERREVIRILTEVSDDLRPHVPTLMNSYHFLAEIDLIQAKVQWSEKIGATEPKVLTHPHIDWIRAQHPLLRLSLERQGKQVVPLDVTLTSERRLLIISGPNAGGKSVCLKTVGLLQYMLQCGLPISLDDRSKTGIFEHIMIDIGDEQSIEDDLSTYSSHLTNMKQMILRGNRHTLLLIDEFGGGTEPQIGGAIAEAVLKQFCEKKAWGIITTHYQNLKHFAESHDGVVNGAMLYDRQEMRPLFQLAIGQPGSSFAIEIARKIGLPDIVIRDASEIVGSDYIQSDKYLQDIIRDKRYWEGKRQTIHQQEKQLEQAKARYERVLADLESSRKEVLQRAKKQAEELLLESNKKIENTIREIKESQAEREETRRIREGLSTFRQEVNDLNTNESDEMIARKIKQIQERKERKAKRKKEKAEREEQAAHALKNAIEKQKEGLSLQEGDTVRMKGQHTVGTIETIEGKMCTVIFGGLRTKTRLERLEHADKPKEEPLSAIPMSRMTRETIDERRHDFRPDIDVRGMRGDEALNAVMYYIDDAILMGVSQVRILHGTGNGILRQLIRQYLGTVPLVRSYRDEHVQFGGAGITVVEL